MTADEKRRARRELDKAYDALEREVPDPVSRTLRWLRTPASRWVRIPLGLFFIACSFLGFMPVVGIEFLPIGLLLLAQDMPYLRVPVSRALLWLEQQWFDSKRRWTDRHCDEAPKRAGR